jgi:hypothetical protein
MLVDGIRQFDALIAHVVESRQLRVHADRDARRDDGKYRRDDVIDA